MSVAPDISWGFPLIQLIGFVSVNVSVELVSVLKFAKLNSTDGVMV